MGEIVFDCGGSNIRCRATLENKITREFSAPWPSSLSCGAEVVADAIFNSLRSVGIENEDLSSSEIVVAIAGTSFTSEKEKLLRKFVGCRNVKIISDVEAAVYGANQGKDCGVVVAGTGTIAMLLQSPRLIRFGGHGFLLGDGGGGAQIGLQAVRRTLSYPASKDPLVEAIKSLIGSSDQDIIKWGTDASAADFAKLFPTVVQSESNGSTLATTILAHAASHVENLITNLNKISSGPVFLVGGTAEKLQPYLSEEVRCSLTKPTGNALDGALHYLRCLGKNTVAQVKI